MELARNPGNYWQRSARPSLQNDHADVIVRK
jgi:hypothetical protein